mgnify:CR=1 FL=1
MFALLRQASDPAAADAIETLVRDAPDHDLSRINVLSFARQHGLSEETAIAAFLHGIEIAPVDDELYLNLGRLYLQTGQPERARTLMLQLLDRKPDSVVARRALREMDAR